MRPLWLWLLQEHCYVFVHDEDKLSSFFEEDTEIVAKRSELAAKRDRLAQANAAMANIQLERQVMAGPKAVRVTIAIGSNGVGLQLADEGNKLVVRGFRPMPDGIPNPGQDAGVQLGDQIDQVRIQTKSSFVSTSPPLLPSRPKSDDACIHPLLRCLRCR